MKTALFVCALVALAIGLWAAKIRSKPPETPTALQPTVSWTPPPTTIDASYVAAASLLVGNGLGDPRGRRFSSMNVALGVADGHPGLSAPVYGWVSPTGKSALLLDGVEYGGISNVAPADLGKVVAGLLIDAKEHRPYSSLVLAPAGEYNPALPALLLIADRPDLAEVSYAVSPGAVRGAKGDVLASWLYDRYKELVAEARLEGNLREGLDEAKRYVSVALLKSQMEKVGDPDRPPDSIDNDLKSAQNLVKSFSIMLATHASGLGDVSLVTTLDNNSRLATLIDGLDAASSTQGSMGARPILTLTNLGDPAIPALVDVLESDQRPLRQAQVQGRQTMTIRGGQSFGQGTVTYAGQTGAETVKDVAWTTIQSIWPMCARWQKPGAPYPDSEFLRQKWKTDSTLPVPERWLEVVRDDEAGEQLWLQAAEYLTSRSTTSTTGSSPNQGLSDAPLAGDAIKPTHGPEVDTLLAKRCLQITNVSSPNAYEIPGQKDALTMANDLYRWHPAASLQALKAACKHAMILPKPPPQPPGRPNMPQQPIQYDSTLDGPFAVAVFERSLLGDRSAAADYAAYSTHVSTNSYLNRPPFLAPLWRAPNDAAIQAVGQSLFRRWLKDMDAPDANRAVQAAQEMIEAGEVQKLMLVEPFRAMLSQSLTNDRELGTATVTSQGDRSTVMVQFSVGTSLRASWMGSANDVVPPGKISVSTGDFIASSLSQKFSQGNMGQNVSTFPAFEVYWPANVRARTKRAIIEWLNDDSRDWPKAVAVLPKSNDDY